MRRLVLFLSLVTLLFAGATVYLSFHLTAERALVKAAREPKPALPAYTDRLARSADSPLDASSSAVEATPPDPAPNVVVLDASRKGTAARAKKFLADIDDPEKHAELLRSRRGLVTTAYHDLGEYLKLTPEETGRFFDLLARQQLASEGHLMRCSLDLSCPYPEASEDFQASQAREIAAEFGTETQQSFDFYRRSQFEREAVRQLRSRLSDRDRLTDEQAASMVEVLLTENKRNLSDARRRGDHVSLSDHNIYVPIAGDPAPEGPQLAAEYNRSLRERVANVLTAGQMDVFDRLQHEATINYAEILKNHENHFGN